MPNQFKKDKLWTGSFINACIGNFLLCFSVYLLLPILPLYLLEEFHSSKTLVGIILACYTIAALITRPLAAFVLDVFSRKPLYLISYLFFALCFIAYPLVTFVNAFLLLRVIHGFAFGLVTTSGNSFIIDIMPSTRRGEGLGYFGVSNTLAMALGPMVSLLLHESYSFHSIFYTAIGTGLVGFLFAISIQTKIEKVKAVKQAIVFDRFFLTQGWNAGICLLLMGIPYSMVTTYIVLYAKELLIGSGVGVFFFLMSLGMIISRLFSGKMVDKGKIVQVISIGSIICAISIFALVSLSQIDLTYKQLILILFYTIAFFLGWGYGMLFPSYNTIFMDLAPSNRRAAASSTYMTTWDVGIGIGLVLGGRLADTGGGLPLAYLVGAFAISFSVVYFMRIAAPHFDKNKLS
jgi:MFS family permease